MPQKSQESYLACIDTLGITGRKRLVLGATNSTAGLACWITAIRRGLLAATADLHQSLLNSHHGLPTTAAACGQRGARIGCATARLPSGISYSLPQNNQCGGEVPQNVV